MADFDQDWANPGWLTFGCYTSASEGYPYTGFHLGDDVWRRTYEAPVYAPAAGRVKYRGRPLPGNLGRLVVIQHELSPGGTSVCSVYWHLRDSGCIPADVEVTKGQIIGYTSLNSNDYGGAGGVAHLHFGIRSEAYSELPDVDGYTGGRYRGYGPVEVAKMWYSPVHFINGTTLIIDERSPACEYGGSSWQTKYVGFSQMMRWTRAWDNPVPDCWRKWNLAAVLNYQKGRFQAGDYEVFAFIPSDGANSRMAKYEIKHNGTPSYRTIDQSPYANQWVSLGTYNFSASGDQYVSLNDNTGEASSLNRMVGYDAIKFVRTTSGDTTPPTISAFGVTPTSLPVGDSVTISYTASDTGGSGLKTAQLWRTPDDGYGVPNPNSWTSIGPATDISAGGNGPFQGSFSDTPPLVGSWWYGVHVNDGANPSSWNDEKNSQSGGVPGVFGPQQVTVTTATAGTVQLSSATYSVNENGGTLTITATRTGGSYGAVSVQYATANGTAIAPGDYATTFGTLTWASGDAASKPINVTIVNDSTPESSEGFTVTLSNPTGGATLGSPAAASVTILDDDPPPAGTLQFAQANYSVNENVATVNLSVTRTGGSSGAVSLQYATANGTALAPGDYTTTSGTINWASGDTASQPITVAIVNDGTPESSESFTVTLSDPTGGATLGSPATATVTILDDEPQPAGKLYFSQATHSVGEDWGGWAVGVRRTGGSSGVVSVQYATANGTAGAPDDYTAISGTLTWGNGDAASKDIPVTIVNDTKIEFDESFTITLFNPTGGAALGSPVTTTLTILEDDGPPPPPTAKPATSVTSTGFVANWSNAPGVTSYYELDVSTSSTFSEGYYYSARFGNDLNWTMTGLNPGTTYYYRVRAYNRVGTSGNSGTISLTTAGISVTPSSQDFGSIQVGTPSSRNFSVQNTGGGTLSGSASVTAPFSIMAGGSYSLGAGASQTVIVSYSPTSAGTHNQTVIFADGGGAARLVSGCAYSSIDDSDGDGMSDWDEIVAGSCPTNRESCFKVSFPTTGALPLSGNGVIVEWFSASDRLYHLDRATNLFQGFNQSVVSNVPPTPPLNVHTDSTAVGKGPYFYRVRVQPQ